MVNAMDMLPIVLFWGLALLGLFGRPQVLLYLFFASMPFGSFAVVPPALTGGLTLTPTPMLALLIILRTLGGRGGLPFFVCAACSPQRLLLLFLFWLVAIVTALFMPRLFAWEVTIIPVRLTLGSSGEPLLPSAQNFSQLAYLSISILATFAFAHLLRNPAQRQHALAALCLGAALTLLTGLLDWLTLYLPLEPLLRPLRTATYALMTEVSLLGGKRVVGLMPEASAYGSLCLSFLCTVYFFRHAMHGWLRERAVPLLSLLLVLFIWLSTSSASYVGLLVFALLAALEWLWRHGSRRRPAYLLRGLGFETWAALLALVGVVLVVLLRPGLLDPLFATLDQFLFSKTQSSSYAERSLWSAVGWQALVDTWGLGVGVGGTRTSNFAAAVFSNTGLLGGLLYFAFVLQTLRRQLPDTSPASQRALLHGVRYAWWPTFVVSLLAGTTANFGTDNAFLYGLALAVLLKPALAPQRALARPPLATRLPGAPPT